MQQLVSILLALGIFMSGMPSVYAQEASLPAVEDVSSPIQENVATSTPLTETVATSTASTSPSQDVTEVIIKFSDEQDAATQEDAQALLDDILNTSDTQVIETLPDALSAVVAIPVDSAHIETLENHVDIEYVEPNYSRSSFVVSWANDAFADTQWALENTGQTVSGVAGTSDADIDGVEAWNLSLGTSTVVAVIDSGVLYTHPDLNDSMWDGTACVDDQGAALGNCTHGYDFADLDSNPLPGTATSSSIGHGTHVAGIIAAERNNSIGIVGAAPSTKIMALRFAFDVASEVKAIDFARQNGAKIINASYGGESFSQAEYDAIERFTDAGGLFIAAAGNDETSNDVSPIYPAAYDLPGIIAVAATDQSDALTNFSNTGLQSVDLGAPGIRIASTFTDDGSTAQYAYAQGTSMAAPYVAATAALIWSVYPSRTSAQVKNDILTGGNDALGLIGATVSGKRLNTHRALLAAGGADVVAPVITLTGASSITLTVGSTYTELGATATDNVDATTTVSIAGSVNTANAATYTLTYGAQDSAGNAAREVTRTVIVQNATSSGGGGGGGGGSRRSSSGGESSVRKKTDTAVVAPQNPARPALAAPVSAPTPAAQASPPTVPFLRFLTLGSTGADVTALQQTLLARGVYTGPVTGYFGPLTQGGVRAYQALHGLEQVGVVGPLTRQLLNEGI